MTSYTVEGQGRKYGLVNSEGWQVRPNIYQSGPIRFDTIIVFQQRGSEVESRQRKKNDITLLFVWFSVAPNQIW